MLERTLVFVDTSYLLASFYNSWETGARAQLEIDLPEVVSTMGGMIENQLGTPSSANTGMTAFPTPARTATSVHYAPAKGSSCAPVSSSNGASAAPRRP